MVAYDWRQRTPRLPTRTEVSVMVVEYGRAARDGELQAQADAAREIDAMLRAVFRGMVGLTSAVDTTEHARGE